MRPYCGGDNVFRSMVRRVCAKQQQQAAADVPIRFEGLPGECLQVDWGEVWRFPFTQQPAATRYFLACRLKYSRWSASSRETYTLRASIEGTLARGIRRCRLRRTRYRGQPKVHLGHILTATGLNFVRLGEWFAGVQRRRSRRSPFTRLLAEPMAI